MKRSLLLPLAILAAVAASPVTSVFASTTHSDTVLARFDGHPGRGFRPGPGNFHRPPVAPGRFGYGWDRGRHFGGHYWGYGWALGVFRGPWFVIEPVDPYNPYGAVWMYVWNGYTYVMVEAYLDAPSGLYWYYGPGNVAVWVR